VDLHGSFFTSESEILTPHFWLADDRALHSTLYTLHSTLYTLHSTLYTLHSTLYTHRSNGSNTNLKLFQTQVEMLGSRTTTCVAPRTSPLRRSLLFPLTVLPRNQRIILPCLHLRPYSTSLPNHEDFRCHQLPPRCLCVSDLLIDVCMCEGQLDAS